MPPSDDTTRGFSYLNLEPEPPQPTTQWKYTGTTITDLAYYVDEDGRTYQGWMAGGK